jgi:RHS repeat-associated protein
MKKDPSTTTRYFPYGDEPATTTQDRPKFATYYRDSVTALDYAQQRYYASTLGRFTTPDPYMASGGPPDPQSWNRYAYVRNDPVNYLDPEGLQDYPVIVSTGLMMRMSGFEWAAPAISGYGMSGFGRAPVAHLLGRDGAGEGLAPPRPPQTLHVEGPTKTGGQYSSVKDAFTRTLASLDPDCEAFLNSGGGNVRTVASDLFEHDLVAVGGFDIKYSAFTNTAGTDLPAGYASMVFNTSSAFFQGPTGMGGVFTVNNGQIRGGTPQAQVFIILHELSHLLSSQGFMSDFGNAKAGWQNDRVISSFCRNTLIGVE